MPKHVLKDVRIFIAAFEVTTFMNSVTLTMGQDAVEKTTFGDTSHTFMPGLQTVSASMSGFQNFDVLQLDEIVRGLVGQRDFPFAVTSPHGGDAGENLFWMQAITGDNQSISGSVGDASSFSLNVMPSTRGLFDGYILEDGKTARVATGNGTAFNLGTAAATQAVYGMVMVLSKSGTPSVIVKIQSDDNSGMTTPTDRITFAAKTLAQTYEFANTAVGAITDTWWRAQWTISGGTPSMNIFVGMAIK